MPPLDEDVADLSSLNFDGMKDVLASAHPYNDLLLALGIHKSFYKLVTNACLLDFTINEVDQYRRLTYIYLCRPSSFMMWMTRMLNFVSMIGK